MLAQGDQRRLRRVALMGRAGFLATDGHQRPLALMLLLGGNQRHLGQRLAFDGRPELGVETSRAAAGQAGRQEAHGLLAGEPVAGHKLDTSGNPVLRLN